MTSDDTMLELTGSCTFWLTDTDGIVPEFTVVELPTIELVNAGVLAITEEAEINEVIAEETLSMLVMDGYADEVVLLTIIDAVKIERAESILAKIELDETIAEVIVAGEAEMLDDRNEIKLAADDGTLELASIAIIELEFIKLVGIELIEVDKTAANTGEPGIMAVVVAESEE